METTLTLQNKLMKYISFCVSLLWCISCSTTDSSINKTFYRVISNDNNMLLDTCASLRIINSTMVVDKLSMDWYVLKIAQISTNTDSVIEFNVNKEAPYIDFEKSTFQWHDLNLKWYSNTRITKNKGTNLWYLYHESDLYDTIIDSIDAFKAGYLPRSIY